MRRCDRKTGWIGLALLATLLAGAAAPARGAKTLPSLKDVTGIGVTLTNVPAARAAAPDARAPAKAGPVWHDSLRKGLEQSASLFTPVLALFTAPDCVWCNRLKSEVLVDPAVTELLQHFTLVEIDVTRNEKDAIQYQLRGVPAILILTSDGDVKTGVGGYVAASELQRILRGALNPDFLRKKEADYLEVLKLLEDNKMPTNRWADVMVSMGLPERRRELYGRILALTPFPRRELVGLLEDPRLAVRLGALDLIEEITGDVAGYSAWREEGSGETNRLAMARLQAWVEEGAGATQVQAPALFTALTRDQVLAYVQDLLSGNRDHALRAVRMLENGGPAVIQALNEFLQSRPDLEPGTRTRIKEVQYGLCLRGSGLDATLESRRLLHGTLDVRLKALAGLNAAGIRALPILADFLEDRDALAREAAADTLVVAAGAKAVPLLKARLAREKDPDVVYSILIALGKVRGRLAQELLVGYLTHRDEELVLAALKSLGALKSGAAESDIGKCMADERWRVRAAALETAATLKLTGLEGKVTGMLADPEPFVRYTAVKTLPEISAKRALKRLEELFPKEDDLKPAIVAAYASLDAPLPGSFGKALRGAGREVIMGVLEAMENSGEKDLAIVEPFLADPDPDIAATTIRLFAAKGLNNARYRAVLRDTLKSGRPELVLAILESARLPRPGYNETAVAIDWSVGDGLATGTVGAADAEALFDAFSSDPAPIPAAATGGAAGAVSAGGMEDLLAAFSGADSPEDAGSGAPSRPVEGCSLRDFGNAVEAVLRETADETTRFKAALLLASLRNPRVVPYFAGTLASRTTAEKVEVVEKVAGVPARQAVPLMAILLQDPAEEVRRAAAEACLPYEANVVLVDTVLKALVAPGTRLKPCDLPISRLKQVCGEPPGARKVGEWARRVLAESGDVPLQNLALIALEYGWQPSDTRLVWPFTRSGNPWQRRAAFHALGKNDKRAFVGELAAVARDSSEQVRAVLPSVYMKKRDQWLNYVEADHFDESSEYSYLEDDGGATRLTPAVRDALQKLTVDSAAAVRVEAYFCLMSNLETVDLAQFAEMIKAFPDQASIAGRVADFLSSNYKQLGPGFRVLVPFAERGRGGRETMEAVRAHFNMDAEEVNRDIVPRNAGPVEATYLPVAADRTPGQRVPVRLVYFSSPGCSACDKVEGMLTALRREFRGLEVEAFNIRKVRSMQIDEVLCERFQVPEAQRLVAPAVFGGAGFLVKADITEAALRDLVVRSEGRPMEAWGVVSDGKLAEAGATIQRRGRAMSVGVVALAGLLDGVNPCAFATIVFLLSYVQLTRRSSREVAQIGLAFVAGVFLAYFVLGLGLVEVLSRIQHVLVWFRKAMNLALAAFSLVILVLNVRDGILCLKGRMADMTLQLPGMLKGRIHGVIRRGARHAHFVVAAFAVGVVVSGIELACTGQVYFPTIGYMLAQNADRRGAIAYLTVYNGMFILPLFAVFLVACFGLTHARLTDLLRRHAALVKFCTAGLFLVLFLFFVFGDRITWPWGP